MVVAEMGVALLVVTAVIFVLGCVAIKFVVKPLMNWVMKD